MKIILSRKGFDSGYGGQPSPILPDGSLLSLPIPVKNDNNKFSDLLYNGKSYFEIIEGLNPKTKLSTYDNCHLDPDIRKGTKERQENWKGLFGQSDSALGHLKNQNIGKGDIFLFFGWFRESEYDNGILRYKIGSPDLHIIFGYLQIGEIYSTIHEKIPLYAQNHPHITLFHTNSNNCIYEASNFLSFDNSRLGSGTLKFSKDLVLTKEGYTRSKWELPNYFRNNLISYHTINSFKQDYFQSAKIGQEFVIDGNMEIINWMINIISHND